MRGIFRSAALVRRMCVGIALGLLPLLCFGQVQGGTPDAEVLPPGVAVRQVSGPAAAVVGTLSAGTRVEVLFTQSGPGEAGRRSSFRPGRPASFQMPAFVDSPRLRNGEPPGQTRNRQTPRAAPSAVSWRCRSGASEASCWWPRESIARSPPTSLWTPGRLLLQSATPWPIGWGWSMRVNRRSD